MGYLLTDLSEQWVITSPAGSKLCLLQTFDFSNLYRKIYSGEIFFLTLFVVCLWFHVHLQCMLLHIRPLSLRIYEHKQKSCGSCLLLSTFMVLIYVLVPPVATAQHRAILPMNLMHQYTTESIC